MTIHQALLIDPVPILVNSIIGSVVDTAGVTTITVPAHADNDIIVAWGSNRTNTPSPVPTDSVGGVWTNITSYVFDPLGTGSDRSTCVAWCRSNGQARTITFNGGSSTASTDPYSGCYIWRNAINIGASAEVTGTSQGTTFAAPALTLTQPPSIVMVFGYYGGEITSGPAGWTVDAAGVGAYAEYLTAWAGGNFGLSATSDLIGCSIELY